MCPEEMRGCLTERLLKEETERTGKSFKRVLNEAIRIALARESAPLKIEPLFKQPFPANLQDAISINSQKSGLMKRPLQNCIRRTPR